MPLRVGLTGGIASGKSEVRKRLAAGGFHTLDLDRLAHGVIAPGGPAYADVVAAFGPRILTPEGAVDRKVLGQIVFRDQDARQVLNRIVHPRVRAAEAEQSAAFSAEAGAVVVSEAALLVEAGVHLRFDRLVVTHCSPDVQVRRLQSRDGMGEEAARLRLRAQMPAEEKRTFGHFGIATGGSLEETWAQVDQVAAELRSLALRASTRVAVDRPRALGSLGHGPRRGPRGLSPTGLLQEIVRSDGVEMDRIAALLVPAANPPWYRAARPDEGPPSPAVLACPLVLWASMRAFGDEEFLLAAAASIARLTHGTSAAIGNACVFVLALCAALRPGPPPPFLEQQARWRAQAEAWAGGGFADELGPVFEAALRHGGDVAAARRACLDGGGGDPDLAGALAGARAGGEGPSAEDAAAVEALLGTRTSEPGG